MMVVPYIDCTKKNSFRRRLQHILSQWYFKEKWEMSHRNFASTGSSVAFSQMRQMPAGEMKIRIQSSLSVLHSYQFHILLVMFSYTMSTIQTLRKYTMFKASGLRTCLSFSPLWRSWGRAFVFSSWCRNWSSPKAACLQVQLAMSNILSINNWFALNQTLQ